MPTSYPYDDIFKRLLEGRISPREAEMLIEWLSRDEADPPSRELILAQLRRVVDGEQVTDELRMRLEAKLPAILGGKESARPSLFFRMRYVSTAAVLLLIGAGIYLFSGIHRPEAREPVAHAARARIDVAPGKQGAILTLADGTRMVLDSLGNGVVAMQNGTKVVLKSGQLTYSGEERSGAGIVYNTMTTPKGRQFQVRLPDGTEVWLDAASSLHYPTAFAGKERTVDVTGEAYFEVAADDRRPFLVRINETTQVQVLGTHFNVNAYPDEATINTTLLEGSVRVVSAGEKVVLRPGQQARAGQSSGIRVIPNADIEKAMAWKNGIFDFQDATLAEVMRQLQRWYDIDVIYEKGVPPIEFIGKMGRDLSLSEVLHGLQMSKVHFRLEEGRKLIVLP